MSTVEHVTSMSTVEHVTSMSAVEHVTSMSAVTNYTHTPTPTHPPPIHLHVGHLLHAQQLKQQQRLGPHHMQILLIQHQLLVPRRP